MASNAFHHVEAGVEVADRPPCPPDLDVLHGPAGFHRLVSRSILHETVHYWQYSSSGYLMGLAAEDWGRLKAFERDGAVPPLGPRREAFSRAKHPDLGFTAKELHEALARFWEMHILGPPALIELELTDPKRDLPIGFATRYWAEKLAGRIIHPMTGAYSSLSFEMAMECAAGRYSEPYRWLRGRASDLLANILFPLCGYFAFQTPDPLAAFTRLVRHGPGALPRLYSDRAVHEWWREAYFPLGQVAFAVARELGESGLEHLGSAVEGALVDHPVWPLVFAMRVGAGRGEFAELPLFNPLTEANPDYVAEARGVLNLDYALACPGDPDYRGTLVRTLAPTAVRFADGTVWNLGDVAATADGDGPRRLVCAAAQAEGRKLRVRWCHFQRTVQGYGPECTA